MSYTIPAARPVPSWVKGQLPTQAMADLLRRQKAEQSEADDQLARARRDSLQLAEAVGLALWKKRANTDLRLLWDALADAGVTFVDHVGEPLAGELEEWADVIDWVDAADGIEPGCVAEAFEPEIRLRGALAHRAKLVGVLDQVSPADTKRPQGDDPHTPAVAGSSTTTVTGVLDQVSPAPVEIAGAPAFPTKTASLRHQGQNRSRSQRKRRR